MREKWMAVSAGYILENDKMTWVMNKERGVTIEREDLMIE